MTQKPTGSCPILPSPATQVLGRETALDFQEFIFAIKRHRHELDPSPTSFPLNPAEMGTVKGILELFCPGFVSPSLKFRDAGNGGFYNIPNIPAGLGIKS